MPPTLESTRATFRDLIRDGMARLLWILAYADFVQNADGEQADEDLYPAAKPGQNWDDVAPETPKAAYKAADDLMKLYEAQNHDLVDLYIFAQTADLEEDFELWSEGKNAAVDRKWKEDGAYEFGGDLAHMAVGSGSSWFDNHKEFELQYPSFECHFDGEDLVWHGGSSDVREVAHRLGRIRLINAGDASWTKHSYVLSFGGFTIASRDLVLVYANNLQDALDDLIDWIAEEHPDSLADDAVNAQYSDLIDEGVSQEQAQEQAEADTTQGGNAGNYIHSEDWSIVAEDPTEGDLKKLAYPQRNPGSPCDPEYHAKLKTDEKAWEELESCGTQVLKKGGRLDLRNCDRCHTTLSVKRNPGRARKATNPPSVIPVPGQWVSWTEIVDDDVIRFDGELVRVCEEAPDKYTAYIRGEDGRDYRHDLSRIEYDVTPRYNLERRKNPSPETAKRRRAEKVLAARAKAGFGGDCDDPECPGWALFETDRGYGVQACDMCNSAAKRLDLPVLQDSDAKELAAARREMARAVRGAR